MIAVYTAEITFLDAYSLHRAERLGAFLQRARICAEVDVCVARQKKPRGVSEDYKLFQLALGEWGEMGPTQEELEVALRPKKNKTVEVSMDGYVLHWTIGNWAIVQIRRYEILDFPKEV